jgi:hypothetical protein
LAAGLALAAGAAGAVEVAVAAAAFELSGDALSSGQPSKSDEERTATSTRTIERVMKLIGPQLVKKAELRG